MKKRLLFIALILCVGMVLAAPPSQQETDFLDELSRRYDLNKALAPKSVEPIRGTLGTQVEIFKAGHGVNMETHGDFDRVVGDFICE